MIGFLACVHWVSRCYKLSAGQEQACQVWGQSGAASGPPETRPSKQCHCQATSVTVSGLSLLPSPLACEGEVALGVQLALVAGVEPATCGSMEGR